MRVAFQSAGLAALILSAAISGAGAAAAVELAADVPAGAYHDQTLSGSERGAIADEENISPNDGRASVPNPGDQAIIPDANDPEKGDTTVNVTPDGALPGDTHQKGEKQTESEANVILDQSKKNFRVSKSEYERCIKQWDPQTQMSRSEWAESCRTTLQYYPEGGAGNGPAN
jgi:hypothetical protein